MKTLLKILLMIVGVAFGMNGRVALAQHENMPDHENMPPGDHAKHKKDKKKDSDHEKKPPPKSDEEKHKGQDKP